MNAIVTDLEREGSRKVVSDSSHPKSNLELHARGEHFVQVASAKPPGRRSRVTFVNRYFYPDISATSQMLYDLARRLVGHGIEVHVICSQQLYGNAQARLAAREEIEGIQVHRVATTRFGRVNLLGRAMDYLSFYVTATRKMLELTRCGDVVVAKTDPPLISVAAIAVTEWRGAKLVNWLQDLFPEVASHLGTSLPGWLDRYLLRLRDQSLKLAEANVTIGSRMRERLLARNVHDERIHVIENWSDGELVDPRPANTSALRASLGLQEKFVVGYSGNLGRAHEYQTILETAIALRHERDIVFLMIGGGVKMQQLKQAVAELRLGNFVFMPYQPRELLADSLAAADVHLTCLLPGLEGLIVPSKFYGVLAAGRPSIIIGDTDGELARVVRREGCGEAVNVGDVDSMVSEIWHLKNEPEYRHQLGARARKLFLEQYTAEHATTKWLAVFAKLESARSAQNSVVALSVIGS